MLLGGPRIPCVQGRQRDSIMHALYHHPLYMNSAVPVHLLSNKLNSLVQTHSGFILKGDATVQSDE